MKAFVFFSIIVIYATFVNAQQYPQYPSMFVRRVATGEATPQLDELHQPGVKQPVGKLCKYADDCISGCCVENSSTRQRYCRPLARYGQRCDEYQIKGGYYWDFCPCQAGEGYCYKGVCSA
ncbi:uncharacterized protein B4U80_06254 [Leptotrombidium deliense]|uniref:Uncharacterized protein n=1 Tax=Leptotrombidium deliense TaxID=299467 RepID=A0A443S3D4_9ACAR|nr:uncharacterized protein B4U80_06254 [Leptotrombidium deliense]